MQADWLDSGGHGQAPDIQQLQPPQRTAVATTSNGRAGRGRGRGSLRGRNRTTEDGVGHDREVNATDEQTTATVTGSLAVHQRRVRGGRGGRGGRVGHSSVRRGRGDAAGGNYNDI